MLDKKSLARRIVIAAVSAALAGGVWMFFTAERSEPKAPPVAAPEDGAALPRVLRDLDKLRAAMLAYRRDVGELPARGNYCPICYGVRDGRRVVKGVTPTDPRPHMDELEQALHAPDGPGWKGPYLVGSIPKDPWGREYTMDDNDPSGANPGDTRVFSAGPDGAYLTGDDIGVLVLSLKDGRLPLSEWRKKPLP